MDPIACRITGTTNEARLEWRAPVLLATFTNAAAAQTAFDAVGKRLAAQERLTLFGQSVLLSGGTVPSNWPAWFKGQGARMLIEYPGSNLTSQVHLSCQAPDLAAATAIQEECEAHFSGTWLRTWPPWAGLEGFEPERRQAIEQTRYTWACLHRIERTLSEDPEYKRISKRLFRRGLFSLLGRRNKEALQQTLDKELALRQTIYRRELDRLVQSKDEQLDQEIVARFDRYWFATDKAKGESFKALEQAPCLRLGTLPLDGNLPASPPAWRATRSGDSERNQKELHFRYLNFYRTDLGLPALLTYLQQKGCAQFRYDIQGSLAEENDDKEDKAEQGR